MKKIFSRLFVAGAILCASATIISCSNKSFTVNGNITGAADSLLLLEYMSLDGAKTMDSVRLGADGAFSFTQDAPQGSPELYRLRIAQQIVNFSVDSTEVITIKATYPNMASDYTVEGSENCAKIKELSILQMNLQARANQILRSPDLNTKESIDSIENVLKAYKQQILTNYIYKEPMKTYAYYALFQGVAVGNNYVMVFDPKRDLDDVKAFSAVATSWDTSYPESERGKNLHDIAIQGMKNKRIVDSQNQGLEIDASKVSEASLIDLKLKDNHGYVQTLSSLKGKVVLLDFHSFSSDNSRERILAMRELYTKYHDRGLEIYQVSLDDDEHFWKTQTAQLPWISVRGDGTVNVYLYQVVSLPVDYIINRDNQVVLGPREITDLEKDLARFL